MTPLLRWSIILPASAGCALVVGLVAAHAGPYDDGVEVAVYAAAFWAPFAGLLYVLLAPRALLPEHPEDNVESAWLQRATSGAFLDLIAVLGVSSALIGVFGLAPVPAVAYLVLGLADAVVRYLVVQRREA